MPCCTYVLFIILGSSCNLQTADHMRTCKHALDALESGTSHQRIPCCHAGRCARQYRGRQGSPQRACSHQPSGPKLLLQGSSGRACSGVPSRVGGSGLLNPPHLPTRNGLQQLSTLVVNHIPVMSHSSPFANSLHLGTCKQGAVGVGEKGLGHAAACSVLDSLLHICILHFRCIKALLRSTSNSYPAILQHLCPCHVLSDLTVHSMHDPCPKQSCHVC